MLNYISPLIRKIVDGKNLTAQESEEAFKKVFEEDQEGFYWTALTSALHTKGETSDELLGLVKNFDKFSIKLSPKINIDNITDVSGTGGDRLKTINVGTISSFVIAAGGITVAKQSTKAWTGVSGSLDIFEALGINFQSLTKEKIEKTLETVGICPYYRVYISPKMKYMLNWFKKIRSIGLLYKTPLHLVSWVYSPVPMRRRVYGCYSEKYLPVLAQLFQKLGYVKGLVVYGVDGIDEISTIGKTKIFEFTQSSIKDYEIEPKDLGLKRSSFKDIKSISKEQNIVDFLRILKGLEKGPKLDLILANSAASFYVMDKVKTLPEGIELASSIIKKGLAWHKLNLLIDAIGDRKTFGNWLKSI